MFITQIFLTETTCRSVDIIAPASQSFLKTKPMYAGICTIYQGTRQSHYRCTCCTGIHFTWLPEVPSNINISSYKIILCTGNYPLKKEIFFNIRCKKICFI